MVSSFYRQFQFQGCQHLAGVPTCYRVSDLARIDFYRPAGPPEPYVKLSGLTFINVLVRIEGFAFQVKEFLAVA